MEVIEGGKRKRSTDGQKASRRTWSADPDRKEIKRVGRAALIDWERYQETGEVVPVEGIPYVAQRKGRHPYGERWLAMNQETMAKVSADKTLKSEPLRLWLYLLSVLDFENWIAVKQADIAAKLGIHKVNISKAFTELERRGMIERGERVLGGAFSWSLNETNVWKGTVPNLEKAIRAGARRRHLQVVEGGKTFRTPPKGTPSLADQQHC